jgi:hypothetical protein
LELQVAFVAALAGLLGGLVGARARTVNEISEAAHRLVRPLNDRIDELEQEMLALKEQVRRFRQIVRMLYDGIETLMRQLDSECISPIWSPPPIEDVLEGKVED